MKIIIIGAGKLGYKLASSLLSSKNYITVIDINPNVVQKISNEMDVMAITGNGLQFDVYDDIKISQYDYMLALTDSDEKNLVICSIVKSLGCKKTIARLRDPEYFRQPDLIKQTFNIDHIVNPDKLVSMEMFGQLINKHKDYNQFFEGATIGMLEIKADTVRGMVGDKVLNTANYLENMLIVSISRKGKLIIPKSHITIEPGDTLYLLGKKTDIARIATSVKSKPEENTVKKAMIMGGGKTGYYLGELLAGAGVSVKIIERDRERCDYLSERLPKSVLVLHGDATDVSLLQEENLAGMDAFVSATGFDEDNIILSLMAQQHGVKHVIAKTSRGNYSLLLDKIGVNTMHTLDITTSNILRFVQTGNFIASSFFLEGQAEVLEVIAKKDMYITGMQLRELKFPDGVLVALIYRQSETIVPTGNTEIREGDKLILFSLLSDIPELERMLQTTRKRFFRV